VSARRTPIRKSVWSTRRIIRLPRRTPEPTALIVRESRRTRGRIDRDVVRCWSRSFARAAHWARLQPVGALT
jgi:hypothetical protein